MAKSNLAEHVEPIQVPKLCADSLDIHLKQLVKVSVSGDGHCFFHSVLRAFHKPYIEAKSLSERRSIVRISRDALADSLDQKTTDGKLYYNTLARGELHAFSKEYPQSSMKYMQFELRKGAAVDNIYHEMVSEQFGLDIYLIDVVNGDVYPTMAHMSDYYKGRRSIFIAVIPGHYDILGLKDSKGIIHTLLTPDHPFTVMVNQRLKSLIKEDLKPSIGTPQPLI
jgi:hypothetical protein